jgi:tRNA G18 (ribose-2'-O)-methylase SpoU
MLDGVADLEQAAAEKHTPYALVFGNEGAGLPPEFGRLGQAVKIRQSAAVDSLNLAVSVAVAAYMFTR